MFINVRMERYQPVKQVERSHMNTFRAAYRVLIIEQRLQAELIDDKQVVTTRFFGMR